VYRGVVRGLSIAVKVFDLSFSDRRDRESVQREIGFMQTLRHRHIIGYLGVRQVDKTLYLYMEYFMATLHHLITKRRDASNVFDVSEVSTFAVQLARALKYLHTRSEPIIHRDLKSENVFIYRMTDKQYVLKLGDFGESTTVERKSIFHQRLMRSVCNVGTTEFRAPELWGKSKGYNTKVDIWAFGMVLFELITLDIPYRLEGLTRFAIPAYIAEGNRPQLPPDTPPTFAPIVKLFNRCSEAAPSARPTAKELVASLDKLNRLFT
jgi:serine/threonine protein kinase